MEVDRIPGLPPRRKLQARMVAAARALADSTANTQRGAHSWRERVGPRPLPGSGLRVCALLGGPS